MTLLVTANSPECCVMTLLVTVNSPEGYVTKLLVTVNSSGLRDNAIKGQKTRQQAA